MNRLLRLPITRFSWVSFCAILLVVAAPPAWAEDRGAQIFETQCASCHGNEGNEGIALKTPILHGQEPAYIAHSLMAFRWRSD